MLVTPGILITLTILITLWIAALPLVAQESPQEQLQQALVLSQQGQFDASIDLCTRAIDSGQVSGIDLGRAYIILGSTYTAQGSYTAAQNALERSLRILKDYPADHGDYASALENYAGLYTDLRQLQVAEPMWQKALKLREQMGDHAAAMNSLTYLAEVAVARKKVRRAEEYLSKASAEMKLADNVTNDDVILFLETQAWAALTARRALEAVGKYQRALDLCIRTHGEQHWLTGWEYILRGEAYSLAGDRSTALGDMREGLTILDHAVGRKNPKYLIAEIVYSRLLDRTGSHAEAAQERASAERGIKDLYDSQCVSCTINVAGFR